MDPRRPTRIRLPSLDLAATGTGQSAVEVPPMRLAPVSILALLLVASGCTLTPYEPEKPASKQPGSHAGSGTLPATGPFVGSVPENPAAPPSAEPGAVPPAAVPL